MNQANCVLDDLAKAIKKVEAFPCPTYFVAFFPQYAKELWPDEFFTCGNKTYLRADPTQEVIFYPNEFKSAELENTPVYLIPIDELRPIKIAYEGGLSF